MHAVAEKGKARSRFGPYKYFGPFTWYIGDMLKFSKSYAISSVIVVGVTSQLTGLLLNNSTKVNNDPNIAAGILLGMGYLLTLTGFILLAIKLH